MADKNVLLAKYGKMINVARNLPTGQEYRALARITLALMTSKPEEHIQAAKSATLNDWLYNPEDATFYFAIQHYNNALKDLKEQGV